MKKYILTVSLSAFSGALIALTLFAFIQTKNLNNRVFGEKLPVYNAAYNENGNINAPVDLTEAAELSVHAVVHIKTEFQQKGNFNNYYDYFDFFGLGRPDQNPEPLVASGSGVIISNDGYIATNNHVVDGADFVEVTLNDKRTFVAKVVGTDPSTDLALLKIDASDLPFIVYGNSDVLKIGEWVLAVGNPFNLTSTVTAGIVSAKARNINILGDNSSIESFIQTDAAVNRGNSGGALVNTRGELVGINAAIASNTGSYAGYSFAIPVNIVKKVMDDLSRYGEVQRAYLGISIRDVDSKLASEKNIDKIKGVYIQDIIENGAAEEAGIKPGDIVTKINGVEVNSTSELLGDIGQYRPGDRVILSINHDGTEKDISVALKNKDGNTNIVKKEESNIISLLGATFVPVNESEKQKLRISNGLKITKLENGKLKNAGIREGFIIVAVDKKTVITSDDLKNALTNKQGGVLIEGIYPNGMRAYYGFGL